MKKFDRIFIICITTFLLIILGVNLYIQRANLSRGNKEYRVAVNRIEQAINSYEEREGKAPGSLEELYNSETLEEYSCVLGMECVSLSEGNAAISALVENENKYYCVIITENNFYKLTYNPDIKGNSIAIFYINAVFILAIVVLTLIYLYLRNNILKPFNEFSQMPYELAKGNLNKPLTETKNKYFGKFIWGMNILRENMEESKARELEAVRDKKVLILSLSHDIKTPLNAISLYAKAISKNLYKDEIKKKEIAENINNKVYEIEGYMSDIIRATNEDFLSFDVDNKEVYISDVLEYIKDYYTDKTALNNIDFQIEKYNNCIIFGDKDRIIEVLQNVVENAIKYGDGRKIWIGCSKDDEGYIISIKNTGCNMPKEELVHIFDSFFRGSNVEKKNGSGLGLYICRQLMHLMEGEILAGIINKDDENIMEIRVILKLI